MYRFIFLYSRNFTKAVLFIYIFFFKITVDALFTLEKKFENFLNGIFLNLCKFCENICGLNNRRPYKRLAPHINLITLPADSQADTVKALRHKI